MEALFSTNISHNNQNVVYQVYSDEGRYVFLPEVSNDEFKGFSFIRDNGVWKDQELLAPELKKQAVAALEKYLINQP